MSTARWDPKGMRRSTGLQSTGATPMTNRSAKSGNRSSPHCEGEGNLIPTHCTMVCAGSTVRKTSA